MENASDALIMAFAVLIFVIALTVAINAFTQAKNVSDIVLYSADKTNFYDYQGATGKASENRKVGFETIIPALYRYYKEDYAVLFRHANSYNKTTGEFGGTIKPYEIYYSPKYQYTESGTRVTKQWRISNADYTQMLESRYKQYFSDSVVLKNYVDDRKIFSFDTEEETQRNEPWLVNEEETKSHVSSWLEGTKYMNPNAYNSDVKAKYVTYINYTDASQPISGGFIKKANTSHLNVIETIGECEYITNQALGQNQTGSYGGEQVGSTVDNSLIKSNKKPIIIFTIVDNII